MIYRPLQAPFNVYRYRTQFRPKAEKNKAGDLDWNSVLASQARDQGRTEQIVDLCRYFGRRNILVLCKRKDQARWIWAGLTKYGEDATLFVGSTKTLEIDSRIIVATCSKGGVGMDAPNLDMLLVASDVEDGYLQALGRVFRREHHFPIVVDLIDSFRPLQKHADTRNAIHEEAGGSVHEFSAVFPHFKAWRKILSTDISGLGEP
jgi:hypothetical protein